MIITGSGRFFYINSFNGWHTTGMFIFWEDCDDKITYSNSMVFDWEIILEIK